MAILVTGGAGYIGSVIVEVLRRRGRDVVVIDDLSRGHAAAVPDGVPLRIGDLLDPEFVESVLAEHRVDSVLHFAAHSLVGESMRDPGRYFRNNVGGLSTLLAPMVRRGVRRLILSSTAAAYGNPAGIPIEETAPTAPTNPYGESKLMCERVLGWYGALHELRWTALRYFNAAGASRDHGEDHGDETHLIPLALRAASGTAGPLPVFGLDYPTPDGTCVRDYIHVEDLAEAHLLALDRLDQGPGDVYNLGNGQGFSVLEVLRACEEVTGLRVPWEPAPRRAGDPPALVASSVKAARELGWKPARGSLHMMVETAWNWMKAHPHGYASS